MNLETELVMDLLKRVEELERKLTILEDISDDNGDELTDLADDVETIMDYLLEEDFDDIEECNCKECKSNRH